MSLPEIAINKKINNNSTYFTNNTYNVKLFEIMHSQEIIQTLIISPNYFLELTKINILIFIQKCEKTKQNKQTKNNNNNKKESIIYIVINKCPK